MAALPERIAKYEVLRRLGQGGMGTVFLGRDRDLDRQVAIKVLRDPMLDDELLERFFREGRAAANLRHENIITIYEVGQHDHQPFMAMEYVDGTSISEIIKKRLPLSLDQKLSYIEQICAGLDHAHSVGIVHRDIKPANLMVDHQGVVRILDFGIARVAGSGITGEGALIGTLCYMSPEQMLGRTVDYRSDIFSVGTVAYELLAYQQAFPGTLSDGLLQRLPNEPPPPLAELCPGLPPVLEPIVLRALEKSPEDRFANLDEMRVALRDARRSIDAKVATETVLVPRGRPSADRPSSRPSSTTADRQELLNRRAREIAVHLDAARVAFTEKNFDGALAACEDALTLDPDHGEAARLLEEIRRARDQRDQDSKARRERERTLRQRVASAEVKLSKGDIAEAVTLVGEVLTEDPRNAAALSLVPRLKEAADATAVILPDSLTSAATMAGTEMRARQEHADATRPATGTTPAPATSRLPLAAIAAAVVLVLGGAGTWLWMSSGSGPTPASTAADAPASTSTVAPEPSAAPDTSPAPDPGTATAAAPPVAAPAPSPVPAPPAAPVSTPPAATPSATTADPLQAQLTRIDSLFQRGDLRAALDQLDGITPSNDNRVATLAQRVAQSAYRSMDAALASATSRKAQSLAPSLFAAAEQAHRLADTAQNRKDFVQAGRQALTAADGYARAEADARLAASATPPANTPAPAPPPAAAPAPAPRAEAAPPPAVAAPAFDPAPIVAALNRFRAAYQSQNRDALDEVFVAQSSQAREYRQSWGRTFSNCRSTDISYANMDVAPVLRDPTAAVVTVSSTYICQPKSRQPPVEAVQTDIFRMRKAGSVWLIESLGVMNDGRR